MYPKKKLRSSLFLTALTLAFLFSLYLIQKIPLRRNLPVFRTAISKVLMKMTV